MFPSGARFWGQEDSQRVMVHSSNWTQASAASSL
jgi:hypothetical protein